MLNQALEQKYESYLATARISIVLLALQHHECCDCAEHFVKQVKFISPSILKLYVFFDTFDFHPKIELMSLIISENPLYFSYSQVLYPLTL